MAVKERRATPEDILAQCCVAFGQGTGPIHVTSEAVRTGRAAFHKKAKEHADTWPADALRALGFARALGAKAAALAVAGNAPAIESGHVAVAIEQMTRLAVPLEDPTGCPWC